MPGKSYSKEEEAALERMWRAGVSAKYIGREIGGRTKDSIIGKAHRMGLPPHVKAEPEPVPFEEIDTIRLPKLQRRALAVLLDAHPLGLPHKEIGRLIYPDGDDDTYVTDLGTAARSVVHSLNAALRPFGWACGCLGDRSGVKLYSAKEHLS